MKFIYTLPLLVLCSSLYLTFTNAANFNIVNQRNYTVWAARSRPIMVPRCGSRHHRGSDLGPNQLQLDANGHGQFQTGDCNGRFECQGYGRPPNTLAEFALNQNNSDYIDTSNVDGFNIPLEFSSVTPCHVIRCSAPIVEQCPDELRTPGGCNNPCTVFKTNEHCCTNGPGTCGPTNYSRFFKDRCPDAYSYPQDDRTSLFTCPSGTNYRGP